MAVTYTPTSHTLPTTAVVNQGQNVSIMGQIAGLSPGRCAVALNDGLAPATILLPTGNSADGYPTAMLPFSTGTGTVS